MAVCKVKKIEIIAHAQCRGEILEELRRLGSVHISDVRELFPETESKTPAYLEKALEETEAKLDQVRFCSDFVEKFAAKPPFIEGILKGKPVFTARELHDCLDDFDLSGFHEECREAESEIADNESRTEKNEALMEDVAYWRNLDYPLELIRDTRTTRLMLSLCETRAYDPMIEELAEAGPLFHVEIVDRSRTSVSLLVAYHNSIEEQAGAILRQHGCRPVRFAELTGTPAEVLERSGEVNRLLHERNNDIRDRIERELTPSREKLLLLLDHYTQELETLRAHDNFLFTSSTFLISGWVVASREDELRRRLEEATDVVEIRCSDPGPEDVVPTLLENGRVTEPFALVTELYGRPQYTEFDPTPLLAPFFAVFFGICLGDGGYGIILIIASLVALKKLPVEGGARRLLQILLASGIATMVFGFLTGSIFGIEMAKLPPVFENLIIFNPTTEIIGFLYLSFAIGIFHILFGIGVKLTLNLRDGDIKSAIVDQVAWMLFIISVAPLGLKHLFGGQVGNSIISVGFKGAVLFGGLIILFGGRQVKFQVREIGKHIGLGSMGALRDAVDYLLSAIILLLTRISLGFLLFFKSLIDYFGDVLSYSRLMALGLATAFLSVVINQMAGLALGIPYGIGIIAFVLILVFGHTFNLVINCLSAFVHTLRLQYLEFFSKFFVGGGEPFRPFAENRQHTLIQLSSGDA